MRFPVDDITVYYRRDSITDTDKEYLSMIIRSIRQNSIIERRIGINKIELLLAAIVSYSAHCIQNGIDSKIVYLLPSPDYIQIVSTEYESAYEYLKTSINIEYLSFIISRSKESCQNILLENEPPHSNCDRFRDERDERSIDDKIIDEKKEIVYYDFSSSCQRCSLSSLILRSSVVLCVMHHVFGPQHENLVLSSLSNSSRLIIEDSSYTENCIRDIYRYRVDRQILNNALAVLRTLGTFERNENEEESMKRIRLNEEWNTIFSVGLFQSIPHFYLSSKRALLPGNIRNDTHFLMLLNRAIEYLKVKLKAERSVSIDSSEFITNINDLVCIDKEVLRFCSQRLFYLLERNKQSPSRFKSLIKIANFLTVLGILDGSARVNVSAGDSSISLSIFVVDCRKIIQYIGGKVGSILCLNDSCIPSNLIENAHQIQMHEKSFLMSLFPTIINKGSDQTLLCSGDSVGGEAISVVRNYGNIIISMKAVVPGNMLFFFPNHKALESVVSVLSKINLIEKIREDRLLFIEPTRESDGRLVVDGFLKASNVGISAILFCTPDGILSKSFCQFSQSTRLVAFFGIPLVEQNSDFSFIQDFENECMRMNIRKVMELIGQLVLHGNDYKMISFIDNDYTKDAVFNEFPSYFREFLSGKGLCVSIEEFVDICKGYYVSSFSKTVDML